MTLPQGADYSLTENAFIPFQAEPTHFNSGQVLINAYSS
jgi:hypothetical protein